LNDFAVNELNVHDKSQAALTAWGKLLISTGGVLKPENAFTTWWIKNGMQMNSGSMRK